jgi:heterodisulfide reductase subunit B2
MSRNLSYYPGCSLGTSSAMYDASIRRLLAHYGVKLTELDDWSCCGASAATTIDETLSYALAGRNIAIAEGAEQAVLAPCSACYMRLHQTNEAIQTNQRLKQSINLVLEPLAVTVGIEVKNIIEVLQDLIGLSAIAREVRFDLSALKVVPYYGCVLTRTVHTKSFDDRENPKSMDRILAALGSEVLSWPYKMECCGASKTVTEKNVTGRMSGKIVDRAVRLGADAIVTPCPLCQMNLDLLPFMAPSEKALPVLFLTELCELALFGSIRSPRSHIVSVETLLTKTRLGRAVRKDPLLLESGSKVC